MHSLSKLFLMKYPTDVFYFNSMYIMIKIIDVCSLLITGCILLSRNSNYFKDNYYLTIMLNSKPNYLINYLVNQKQVLNN